MGSRNWYSPLTTDPENPIKPFADYVMEDDDRYPYDRR